MRKENVLHRAIDLVQHASANPYRLASQVVVLPRTTDDIIKLFRDCRETRRQARVSNGQLQSDNILIDELGGELYNVRLR
jgi:D-lactate dehydrogenase